ncbi:diguanylate cyclase (GGDEF) domain/uncharacterized domain HDIG-containing protein [Chthonomonas calidirosea]|uniref:Diguanylate cyclase (GGDEF) domain/uncharacterized domain HDIG n=1 Tax=Chthonomonas calidirosea (strain DSM 23976 / ICMP 18418 / T49) TaxID=1303518 RepID=S0F055_CHTCT|nr:diguanylate cyclase [Chthonomonas calidirosea]CCW36533.1 diguanylate cyclase (GGDEF) domain/uncharacterized domain HDIG [Chthonomonas calidirosea T49]CEK17050.1 diguanylate cyclase (GGDEF) domain/uncharacterized domain HDIG-containing protein [Chthonomonas calidirosea]
MAASVSLPWNEEARLCALYHYALLDTLPEREFDDLVLLAAQICKVPISLISLIDRDRQWFKARLGVEVQETPRELAFCNYTILSHRLLVVPDARKDPRFQQHPFVIGPPYIRFYAGAPLITSDGYALGTLCVLDTVPRRLRKAQQEALLALARQIMSQIELRFQRRMLEKQAATDFLTGVGNVRYLREQLDELFWQARRGRQPLSLVMVDVDHFKAYNDTFGHLQGDLVLQKLASILQAQLRAGDVLGRYGGEEFMVILPQTDKDTATSLAERLRCAVERYPWLLRPITASCGVATLCDEVKDVNELVEEADQALYISKHLGRNRVTHYEAMALEEELAELLSAAEMPACFPSERLRQRLYRHLERVYSATIEGWSRILDLRDKETEGHSQRVTELSLRLAEQMGFSDRQLLYVRWGALLHDIGKIGIPDSILHKAGPLTEEEWAIMRRHPEYAYEMLSSIPFLRPALDIPYCHHERWDGSGYPRGLRGEEIPLAARIFAVVDVWDALRSDRPYRKGWPEEKVLEYLRDQSGHHFDPAVVTKFFELIGKQAYPQEQRKAA